MKLVGKKLFTQQPDDKTGVISWASYCNNKGDILKYSTYTGSSDAFKGSTIQFSTDGGKTYSEPIPDTTRGPAEGGMMTKYFKLTAIDPKNDRLYMFYNMGLLPNDRPEDGLQSWQMYYRMSEDGGRTFIFEKPVIMTGHTIGNPIDGVYIGKNNFMVGDRPCEPIVREDGTILMAVQCTYFDEEGNIFNPGGGYTYQYSVVLHGRFLENGEIEWNDISNKVEGDPAKTTRGTIEPAIREMPDGRILMICRGSNGGINDPEYRIPGYRWFAVSNDRGHTFSEPQPWTYSNGEPFHSPSSCSMILDHSNGNYYWIGNICEKNPRANMPRNPLCIVEIDQTTLLLKKETKYDFINREPHQYHDVTFSNFYAREEKGTGDILVYCSAFWQSPENTYLNTSSYEYRLAV
ncbi:MAG: sialidase family protein [Clostridia bacterium]|nr:sialidase family protein [Clostridia bacterium]